MAGRRSCARGARRRATAFLISLAAMLAFAAPAAAQPLYGVVPQDNALPDLDDIAIMPSGGITHLRLMAHWPTIEPSDGFYDWSILDAMVRESVNRGVDPLLYIYGTPTWAARADGRSGCSAHECSLYAPSSAETRRAFADFAADAVRRYGPGGAFWEAPVQPASAEGCHPLPVCPPPPPPPPPGTEPPPTEPPCGCTEPRPIRKWQLWNEQNSSKFFAPAPDIRSYAALVKAAGDAIHQVDPGADVILGGMWGPQSAAKVVVPVKRYLNGLYRVDGISKSFDSIALHPYSQNVAGSLAQLDAARKVAKRHGDGKVPIWITEIGWASAGPKGDPYVKGRLGQARILSRAMKAFEKRQRRFHIRGVFWYAWRDRPREDATCHWCVYSGLRAKNGSPKPAWRAFVRVATR